MESSIDHISVRVSRVLHVSGLEGERGMSCFVMILILRQFLVGCQPTTGEVRAMGFVSVTFGIGCGMHVQSHPKKVRERKGEGRNFVVRFPVRIRVPECDGATFFGRENVG